MQKSGWTPGTALGASSTPIPVSQSSASQVKIRIKDDTLGLGANLKSRDVESQRTGLDAFQGLLGRLNAKDQKEVEAVEAKAENKKLAMFAVGRWGGMTFVPGGVLVQEDPRKQIQTQTTGEDKERNQDNQDTPEDGDAPQTSTSTSKSKSKSKSKSNKPKDLNETPEQRAHRKSEKRARKEAKLLRKLQREARRTGTGTETLSIPSSEPTTATATATSTEPSTTTNTGTSTPTQMQSSNSSDMNLNSISTSQTKLKNGRHLLRGRNIQAKKMAFSDARGLDQIFMRRVEGKTQA